MQLTLKEMKERGEHFPANTEQATKIPERILNRTVRNGQPLSVVGDKGLPLLISHPELRYKYFKRGFVPIFFFGISCHFHTIYVNKLVQHFCLLQKSNQVIMCSHENEDLPV